MAKAPETAPETEEYQVLNLKYRPQVFSEVVGQRSVVRQLQGEIRDGRVGHAYLFCGPRGVGKTSLARIFAKALNCVSGPTPEPCGKCTHCIGITNDADLDVVEVDAATHTQKDETVELLRGIDRVAFNSRYKVYIIDEVHMFSRHSFNVLLKRLEEPPPSVVFILATTNPENIPETVLSRCRKVEFERMDSGDIVSRLNEIADREKLEFEEGDRQRVLEAIALASEGGMRDAQVSLDQLISLSDGKLSYEGVRMLLGVVEGDLLRTLLEALVQCDSVKCLEMVHELVEKGRDLSRFAKTFSSYLRDAMLLKANAPEDLLKVSRTQTEELRTLIESVPMATLLNMMQQFLDLEEKLRGAAPARFVLEFTLLKLTAIHPSLRLDGGTPPPRDGGEDNGGSRRGALPRTPPGGQKRSASGPSPGSRALVAGGGVLREAAEEIAEMPEIEYGAAPEVTRQAEVIEISRPAVAEQAPRVSAAAPSVDESPEGEESDVQSVPVLAPPVSLKEALIRFPEFRAAVEIARQHLGVDPVFISGNRIAE